VTTRRSRDPKAKPLTCDEIMRPEEMKGLEALIATLPTPPPDPTPPPTARAAPTYGYSGVAPSKLMDTIADTIASELKERLRVPLIRNDEPAAKAITSTMLILEDLFSAGIDLIARTSTVAGSPMEDVQAMLQAAKHRLEAERFKLEAHWRTGDVKIDAPSGTIEKEPSPFLSGIEEIE
jgi:hypothetical protein